MNENKDMVEVGKNKGIGKFWKNIGDRTDFKASDGIVYEFVDYWEKLKLIRLWAKGNEKNALFMVTRPITDFSSDDLKGFGIWEGLSDSLKKEVENSVVTKMDVFNQAHPTEKVVRHRKSKEEYIGVPRVFSCHECGKSQDITPAMVIQKAKAKGITVEEFEKTFVCNVCKPAPRGKKASPKYAGMPKEFKCSKEGCENKCIQHPSMTLKVAEKLGVTWQEYVGSWLCKEHRVKKIHHFTKMKMEREARGEVKAPKTAKKRVEGEVKRRGRAANPAFEGIAKELICSDCGFKQPQHPSISIKAAESKGITLDEYFSSWKCRDHREKKAHHLSKEGRALRKQK